MARLEGIRKEVENTYKSSSDECMREWFFENHVQVVAKYGKEISSKFGANKEIVVLSALFHDIARAWGTTKDPNLMNESLSKAEEIMKNHGYDDKEVKKVKETIITHSCRKVLPKTKEGKVLATADALAHLMTDFYLILVALSCSCV